MQQIVLMIIVFLRDYCKENTAIFLVFYSMHHTTGSQNGAYANEYPLYTNKTLYLLL